MSIEYQTTKEEREYQREYRANHREHLSGYNKEYYANHVLLLRLKTREHKRRLRKELVELLGSKCSKCGFTDWRALQVDHVNGGGLKQRDKLGGNYYMYLQMLIEIKAGSKDYQLLCANCNWIKRYERNEIRR